MQKSNAFVDQRFGGNSHLVAPSAGCLNIPDCVVEPALHMHDDPEGVQSLEDGCHGGRRG